MEPALGPARPDPGGRGPAGRRLPDRGWRQASGRLAGTNIDALFRINDYLACGVVDRLAKDRAFKDGKPIRASDVGDPTRAIAILGHSRRTSFGDYQAVARRLNEMGAGYRRMGAAAIGLVRVADGIADLYYERHLNG